MQRPSQYFADLQHDIRHGLRVLAGSPGFTLVALLSLTLGIAIATSAYSEMNGLILRDLPGVPNPDSLVALQLPASYPSYKRYRELTGLFSSTLAYLAPVPFGVSLNGHTQRTWGHLVTPSYFSTLGARPALGRVFDQAHEQPGQSPVVVVSYRFWQNRLGYDRSIIGKTLRINGHPCVVIGVGPKDFLGASPALFRGGSVDAAFDGRTCRPGIGWQCAGAARPQHVPNSRAHETRDRHRPRGG